MKLDLSKFSHSQDNITTTYKKLHPNTVAANNIMHAEGTQEKHR